MLLNSYEVFDQLIVGAVVGGLIMIVAYIMKFFKQNKSDSEVNFSSKRKKIENKIKIPIVLEFFFFGIGVILSLSEQNFEWAIIFTIPFIFAAYRIRQGYLKSYLNQDEDTHSINDESKEEINQAKEEEKTNINALADDLNKLGELKEKGFLTEEEFNEQKKKLLNQ
jgi:hypothetical protein